MLPWTMAAVATGAVLGLGAGRGAIALTIGGAAAGFIALCQLTFGDWVAALLSALLWIPVMLLTAWLVEFRRRR